MELRQHNYDPREFTGALLTSTQIREFPETIPGALGYINYGTYKEYRELGMYTQIHDNRLD